ncbi:PAS domain-containing protein, partial [Nostoc sp.]|uniref:PAS domain-containing protein n=1 Tax=Nostoc sp. TaxID=1180 RepID=UPI003FA59750
MPISDTLAIAEWYEENFWVNHLHPDDKEKSVRFRQEATARCENHELEYRMLAADGRVVLLRDVVSVVEEAGIPTMLSNTFRLSLKTGKLRVVPENQQLNATQKIFVGR